MTIVIDPSKDGLEKVLRDYQIEALRIIWNSDNKGMTSREVYQAVNRSLGSKTISRASIINFLNDMCDENILKFDEETCKGGTRRKYFTDLDETGFKKHVAKIVLSSLMKDFPAQTKEAVAEAMNDD